MGLEPLHFQPCTPPLTSPLLPSSGNPLQEVVEDRRMSVPRLLLPAILLHGTFDFILMAMAMIQYCYGLSEGLFNVLSLAVGTWHQACRLNADHI